jgi:flagellar hook-associated protein FlgK
MSTQVSRDKYIRLKQKAEKWQILALDYKDRIPELQDDLAKRPEDNVEHVNNYKKVISDLTEQVEKWKSKAETNNDSSKLREEMKELKALHKEKLKEIEDKHKDQLRELKYESREKIADLKSDLRLKDGEIQTEKRSAQDTIKYWKVLYEEESRKNHRKVSTS